MSKQDWRTPPEFITAVERRFGLIGFDLAATDGHEVTRKRMPRDRHTAMHFSPERNSLKQNWSSPVVISGDCAWLNPPFANIRPWVAKLDEECSNLPRWTLCLVPASMGSKWWRDHVINKCFAMGVTRMAFCESDGTPSPTIYAKDLALLCYGFGVSGHGFWDWRETL